MAEKSALHTLELLGAKQWSLVTTAQAAAHGVSRQTLSQLNRAGVIHRIRHGVYRLPSTGHEYALDAKAAWLALGSEAHAPRYTTLALSHEAAADFHRLGTLIPNGLDFTSTEAKRISDPRIRVTVAPLPDSDVSWVRGFPVTSVARTVHDLAARGHEFEHLAEVATDAWRKEGVTAASLSTALEETALDYGFESGGDFFTALLSQGVSIDDIEEVEENFKLLQNTGLITPSVHV